jgi:EAL domain-containing protein (putative c-di-GMP-specific phosphodiesterase class I)
LVSSDLTSRAAFSLNVRAFLLVKDKIAFCSSATGPMNVPLADLVPDIDVGKSVDMALLPGTPMMPNKPAIVLWFRNPLINDRGVFTSINLNLTPYLLYTARQDEFAAIALVVGNTAFSTYSDHLLHTSELTTPPVRTTSISDLPMKINLYAEAWTPEDLQFAILFGVICGISSGFIFYFLGMARANPRKEILTAIKQNQFYVVYQPVVDAGDLKMRGVEVLMRWRHPGAGEIPPDAFINFAEAQQLIVPLTLHLFDLILRDAPMLKKRLPPGAKLGINIAPGHLHADSFKEDMRKFAASLPPDHFQVVLEITERDMLQHSEATRLFEWLHLEGFEVAIDDFGTGHSALIYLEHFSMDYLKIDRGFVNTIGMETVTSPVLDAVITLSDHYGGMADYAGPAGGRCSNGRFLARVPVDDRRAEHLRLRYRPCQRRAGASDAVCQRHEQRHRFGGNGDAADADFYRRYRGEQTRFQLRWQRAVQPL